MNLETLRQIPDPASLPSDHLRALWFDLHGDWDSAHTIVQGLNDVNAMWIHAYLHRKEPDVWNARYWYHQAGISEPDAPDYIAEAALILASLEP